MPACSPPTLAALFTLPRSWGSTFRAFSPAQIRASFPRRYIPSRRLATLRCPPWFGLTTGAAMSSMPRRVDQSGYPVLKGLLLARVRTSRCGRVRSASLAAALLVFILPRVLPASDTIRPSPNLRSQGSRRRLPLRGTAGRSLSASSCLEAVAYSLSRAPTLPRFLPVTPPADSARP